MKILVDMNLSPNWIQFLADHGIEAVHWSAIGAPNATDSEILEFARDTAHVIFTHDLDFGTILATSGSRGSSVIQVRTQRVLPSEIGEVVIKGILAAYDFLVAGAIVSIDEERARVRILPV